jgi:glycerol-1-phosphate dehydrogenase [NAD(P)+]
MSRVESALKSAGETKALRIGRGELRHVAELFGEQFPGKKAIVVADSRTYGVAGKRTDELLASAGIQCEQAFIFADPEPYAEYCHVDALTEALRMTDAVPVAAGSGTINDLTKLSAHLTGRQYLCVATAASMDGYTAFGASITANGAKQTFSCPAPQACLADIDIIAEAPAEMTASGYADLFAKITAGADWILADMLEIEPVDRQAWSIVQDGLADALRHPEALREGKPEQVAGLIEGLMLGGFAMQWSRSSRPASGAEHQFSHLWNMEHHLNNGKHVSHGFQVSIGTLAVTAFYEQLLNMPIDRLDTKAACRAWHSREALERQALSLFKDTDFPETGLQETRAKYIDRQHLADQLELLVKRWAEIKRKLEAQLLPYGEVKRRLQTIGAPVEPEQIGITRERLRETFIRAQFIRRRFTVLDLAVRTNLMQPCLDGLFGKDGQWSIKK